MSDAACCRRRVLQKSNGGGVALSSLEKKKPIVLFFYPKVHTCATLSRPLYLLSYGYDTSLSVWLPCACLLDNLKSHSVGLAKTTWCWLAVMLTDVHAAV